METESLGVVIVNYKTSDHLVSCVGALQDQPGVGTVFVVDNDSGEEEMRTLDAMFTKDPLVTVIRSPRNGGFGAGVNIGVDAAIRAGFDAIWILNPDTVAEKNCAIAILRALNEGWDIVSPVVVTGDTQLPIVWFAGGTVDLPRVSTPHHHYHERVADIGLDRAVSQTGFVSGAAIAMSKSAWERLGGFREDYFMYWEDADLSYRASNHGLKLGVVRDAAVWHEVGGSVDGGGASRLYYWHMQRNRVLFAREYLGDRKSVFRGPGLLATAKLTLAPLKESADRFGKFAASVSGLWSGLTARDVSVSAPTARSVE
jgi:GT2 family glycosyltransferase